jgi:hypothetical protein
MMTANNFYCCSCIESAVKRETARTMVKQQRSCFKLMEISFNDSPRHIESYRESFSLLATKRMFINIFFLRKSTLRFFFRLMTSCVGERDVKHAKVILIAATETFHHARDLLECASCSIVTRKIVPSRRAINFCVDSGSNTRL